MEYTISAVIRACVAYAWLALPAFAQGSIVDVRDQLQDIQEWDELCAITDCSQFPLGYHTYHFGPQVYFFPNWNTMTLKPPNVLSGGVKSGGFVDRDDQGNILRSVSKGSRLTLGNCCHFLLSFYGLAEALPEMGARPPNNRMPATDASISPFNQPDRDNRRAMEKLGLDPQNPISLSTYLSETQASFNDDFWLINVGETDDIGRVATRLLSKRPLLNGYHVYGGCQSICSFHTVTFSESAGNTRPHVSLPLMTMRGAGKFLCELEELKDGCVPAAPEFYAATAMLEAVDAMFKAAQVFPNP